MRLRLARVEFGTVASAGVLGRRVIERCSRSIPDYGLRESEDHRPRQLAL